MNKHLSMNMFPLRNITRAGRFTILLPIGIMLISSLFLSSTSAQDEPENNADSRDMLAYVSDDGHLMLYDPRDRTEITLLDNIQGFELGRDGRVAFTRPDENDPDLYVFDPSTPNVAPINITQNPAAVNYPIAWSPDGRYLAFGSYQDSDDQSLYVWYGETTTNIMPDNGLDTADIFYVDWSHDGRLVFTIQHGWSSLDIPSEIYVWDGNTTTNLSQNPEASDGAGSWSRDGQLLFGSQRDEEGGLYVWDGVSFKDSSPDVDSFIRLAPELEPTRARWTDDGLIAFTAYSDPPYGGTKAIILWDIESESVVKQFPISSENEGGSWLAEGGQVILSSHLASGSPSYYLDIENTEGQILFSTVTGELSWSGDGYLAHCGLDEGRVWLLSIWDGEESWLVAKVGYTPVQWQNGGNTFSCNNG
jgi:WD40 repeat protein